MNYFGKLNKLTYKLTPKFNQNQITGTNIPLQKDENCFDLPWLLQHANEQKNKTPLAFTVSYAFSLTNQNKNSHISIVADKPTQLSITWQKQILCKRCGKQTRKSYAQGFCFICFKKAAACDLCMMKPHTCHFHEGTCREPTWAEPICFDEHIVYLSFTDKVKVGITKASQVPTRWVDQGALAAIPIIKTSSRRLAGSFEFILSAYFADKTNWRNMLRLKPTELIYSESAEALIQARNSIFNILSETKSDLLLLEHLKNDTYVFLKTGVPILLHYPIWSYQHCNDNTPNISSPNHDLFNLAKDDVIKTKPDIKRKVTTLNLEQQEIVSGKLLGIKGQYLELDTGFINIRKYSNYAVCLSLESLT